jgi:hypothetical protein
VVKINLNDAQAVSIMGSTGRTDEEQARLDNNPAYDPYNHRIVIAESGAVRPGYQLDSLQLTALPNGASLPPGEFGATAYLIFYDIDFHGRAMLESQFPVVLAVRN